MISTDHSVSTTEQYVRSVEAAMERIGDRETARQIGELTARLKPDAAQVTVAFCGLFSAGKSSLLNALTGTFQLVEGVVPTTAEVTEVALPGTGGRVLLLDTPGVDSTQTAHQVATDAAMHRADVVVLVVDSQHVAAQGNLELARSLSGQRKQLVLVVHQVDKHLDFELPFVEFQAGVKRTLENWDMNVQRIFYTATKPAPQNELENLRAYLGTLAEGSVSATDRVLSALKDLVEKHVDRVLTPTRLTCEQALREALGIVPYDRAETTQLLERLQIERETLRTELEAEGQALVTREEAERVNLEHSVDLAQIAPYGTTELGRSYIESLQPGFRPSWFRIKQRIEQEQEVRCKQFVEDLAERTRMFLVWPLQSQLRSMVRAAAAEVDETWFAEVDQLKVEVGEVECTSQVKTGALVSTEYPYQYVKDVVATIKHQFHAQLVAWLERWFAAAKQRLEQEQVERNTKLAEYGHQVEALEAWVTLQTDRDQKIVELLDAHE